MLLLLFVHHKLDNVTYILKSVILRYPAVGIAVMSYILIRQVRCSVTSQYSDYLG